MVADSQVRTNKHDSLYRCHFTSISPGMRAHSTAGVKDRKLRPGCGSQSVSSASGGRRKIPYVAICSRSKHSVSFLDASCHEKSARRSSLVMLICCTRSCVISKRQRQRLPRSGARELGGHGMPITSRPEPGGPGARQARADAIQTHLLRSQGFEF